MNDPAVAIISVFGFSAMAFSVKAIANALVRYQETKLRATTGLSSQTEARLERIEHAVDSIAIEIERISEGQRFTTKLLSDPNAASRVSAQLDASRLRRVMPP